MSCRMVIVVPKSQAPGGSTFYPITRGFHHQTDITSDFEPVQEICLWNVKSI